MLEGKDGTVLYQEYINDLENVTPGKAFEIFFKQLERGLKPKEVLKILDKAIHVFNTSLSKHKWAKPKKDGKVRRS